MEWRPDNTFSSSNWTEATERVWSHPDVPSRLKLNRRDIGLAQDKLWPGTNNPAACDRAICSNKSSPPTNTEPSARSPGPNGAASQAPGWSNAPKFNGYCSGKGVVTERAARLLLLTYNLPDSFCLFFTCSSPNRREIVTWQRCNHPTPPEPRVFSHLKYLAWF